MQSQQFADELNNNRKGKEDWKQWGIDLAVNGGYPTFLVEELPANDVAKPNTGLDKKLEQFLICNKVDCSNGDFGLNPNDIITSITITNDKIKKNYYSFSAYGDFRRKFS